MKKVMKLLAFIFEQPSYRFIEEIFCNHAFRLVYVHDIIKGKDRRLESQGYMIR